VFLIGRAIVAILVFVAAYFFSFWLLFVQIIPGDPSGPATLAALLTAAGLAWLAWRGTGAGAQGVLATAATWSAIAGAVGFIGGFFGPMILAPDANQGPLLGLLITGPLGCVVGAVGGLIAGLRRWLNTSAV
jgi:hypothetical protein